MSCMKVMSRARFNIHSNLSMICVNNDPHPLIPKSRRIPQRSFCYVDDAVDGLMRVMQSDYAQPLNVGSDEMVRCRRCSL